MACHTFVCVYEYMCRCSMNLMLGIGAKIYADVGTDSGTGGLNRGDWRKKARSVVLKVQGWERN